jgi:hypothetical protein
MVGRGAATADGAQPGRCGAMVQDPTTVAPTPKLVELLPALADSANASATMSSSALGSLARRLIGGGPRGQPGHR